MAIARGVVTARVRNPSSPDPVSVAGFVENDGYVSMEAEHHTRAVEGRGVGWTRIPGLGRTLSAMTPSPVTTAPIEPGGDATRLEYRMHLWRGGEVTVRAYLPPTLDYDASGTLRYAVSMDDGPIRVVNLVENDSEAAWNRIVSDNIRTGTSRHTVHGPGSTC